jgi:hypothetical protein
VCLERGMPARPWQVRKDIEEVACHRPEQSSPLVCSLHISAPEGS